MYFPTLKPWLCMYLRPSLYKCEAASLFLMEFLPPPPLSSNSTAIARTNTLFATVFGENGNTEHCCQVHSSIQEDANSENEVRISKSACEGPKGASWAGWVGAPSNTIAMTAPNSQLQTPTMWQAAIQPDISCSKRKNQETRLCSTTVKSPALSRIPKKMAVLSKGQVNKDMAL